MPADLSTLFALAVFLGTPTFLGFFESYILERFAWFQKLDPKQKVTWVNVFSIGFGILSYALQTYVPQTEFAQLQPIYAIIYMVVNAIIAFLASQGYHYLTVQRPQRLKQLKN